MRHSLSQMNRVSGRETSSRLKEMMKYSGTFHKQFVSFVLWMRRNRDSRTYPGTRKQSNISVNVRYQLLPPVRIDCYIYRLGLLLCACRGNRQARTKLFRRAMADSRAAKLGPAPEFRLP